jgi:Tol biopolymer transport system component
MSIPFSTHRTWTGGLAILPLLLALTGCGNSTTGPSQDTPAAGSLTITAATTGADLDSDGYQGNIDGLARGAVPVNGTLTVDSVPAGSHRIALTGVAANCATDSAKSVTVTSGQTTAVTFDVTCATNVGTLQIVTSTDGLDIDPDGYTIWVGTDSVAMNAVDTVDLDLAPGFPHLTLTGQAANCTPHAKPDTTAAVTFGTTTSVVFAVTCFKDPIAFERRSASDRNDIYVIDASGGPEVRLTDSPDEFDSSLGDWNPAHTMISFHGSAENSNDFDAYEIALNKSVTYHHTQIAPQWAPVWSPDGSKVAFSGYEPVSSDLQYTNAVHVANADLTGVTRITPGTDWWSVSGWSADGMRLLVTVDSSLIGGPAQTVDIMNADGSGAVNVSNAAGARDSLSFDNSPMWSPDNTKVVFIRTTRRISESDITFNSNIWVVNQDGTGLTQLTNDSTLNNSVPMWSPDGSKIYFQHCGDANCNAQDVWVMNVDGTNPTQITTTGHELLGGFNPAGTKLITVDVVGTISGSDRSLNRLYVQGLDGSNRTALTAEGLDAENPRWR